MKEEIYAAVKESPKTMHRLAKTPGVSYGAVQYYVYIMRREGLVKTVKIGKRVYV